MSKYEDLRKKVDSMSRESINKKYKEIMKLKDQIDTENADRIRDGFEPIGESELSKLRTVAAGTVEVTKRGVATFFSGIAQVGKNVMEAGKERIEEKTKDKAIDAQLEELREEMQKSKKAGNGN